MMVDRPPTPNEQHEWGGHRFQSAPTLDTGGQNFLTSQAAADTDPSQVPFTASYSDDLFAPASNGPPHSQPYVLSNVPAPPHSFHNEQNTPTVQRSFPLPYNRTHLPNNVPLHIPSRIYPPVDNQTPPVMHYMPPR